MSKKYFHFTLGPVQSFVGQARRTRDFWAGSFLLSWLSGIAMQSAISQKGNVLFPKADKAFLDAITGSSTDKPQQGSIPNRFKIAVEEDFDPQQVVSDVHSAWKQLANTIYNEEIASHANADTQAIWDRQVAQFWEMTWVLVDDLEDCASLDRRKNWRSQALPDEAGIKCTLMGEWQELSGIVGVKRKHRDGRNTFWQNVSLVKNSDFAEKEMLCALSYIKRRFLAHFADFTVELGHFTAHGWKLPSTVPSVSYIAAAPWFASVLNNADAAEDVEAFCAASKSLYGLSEYHSTVQCVENAHCNKQLKGIDGNSFHEIALDNRNITPDQAKSIEVKKALKMLFNQHGAIPPFYAVLMMDGDSLGKQMSERSKQEKITTGLAEFTRKVPEIVKDHNGFLIYAGGDDVLALVTLEDALTCALAVRTHYMECFSGKGVETSISAALIYTHINSPLKNILHESHALLDDIAKTRAGRDAIAVRVYKGSGLAVEWAKKWNEAIENEKIEADTIAEQFRHKSAHNTQFSSKFFYKIREQFELLYGKDGQQENPLSDAEAVQLMAMEYIQSSDKALTMEHAKSLIAPLMRQCVNSASERSQITADFALLVRFLAQKGIERGRV